MGPVRVGYIRTSKKDQNPELQRRDLLAAGCEKLFEDVTVVDPSGYGPHPAAFVLDGGYLSRNLLRPDRTSLVFSEQDYYLPLTEYLHKTLEQPLREYATDRVAYDKAFEEFEILLSLTSMNVGPTSRPESAEPPRGRFAYAPNYGGGETTYERLKREATEQGASWSPIRGGLIEADAETLAIYFQNMDGMIRNAHRW